MFIDDKAKCEIFGRFGYKIQCIALHVGDWIRKKFESPNTGTLTKDEKQTLMARLIQSTKSPTYCCQCISCCVMTECDYQV